MKDKIVLITGGSRGIGAAAASEFAAHGAKVIILHKNSSVKTEVKATREIIADISDESAVKNAIDSIIAEFGRIDILVNNAGIAIDRDFEERTVADWRETFATNLFGMFQVSQIVGRNMLENGGGCIVNISSSNAIDSYSTFSVDYDASKAGVISLTKNLAVQFAPHVRVNAIAPGLVNTDMNKDLPADYMAAEISKLCLKRIAEPNEIAKIIRFLASDDASYVNGAVIVADGGRV